MKQILRFSRRNQLKDRDWTEVRQLTFSGSCGSKPELFIQQYTWTVRPSMIFTICNSFVYISALYRCNYLCLIGWWWSSPDHWVTWHDLPLVGNHSSGRSGSGSNSYPTTDLIWSWSASHMCSYELGTWYGSQRLSGKSYETFEIYWKFTLPDDFIF